MSEPTSASAGEKAAPFLLYLVVLVLMGTLGVFLQSQHLHLGLLLSGILCIGVPAFIARRYLPASPAEGEASFVTLKRLGMPAWLLLVVVVTAAIVGVSANLLAALVVELVPALETGAEAYQDLLRELLRPEEPWKVVVGIVSVAISAPLFEEYLFRGAILPMQIRHFRAGPSIVLNGVLFSLVHVNPMGFVALSIVGIFFAHLTVLTRSLWPAIVAHAALNTVNGVILPWLVVDLEAPEDPTMAEILGGLAVLVPLVAGLWWFLRRRILQADEPASDPTSPPTAAE